MPKKPTAKSETNKTEAALVLPAARTRMELLRVATYNKHSEIEEEAFRREFTDLITNAISGAGSLFLQEVAQFIDIAEHDRGCATPAEEFITSMVSSHYRNGGLTPDVVAKEIDPDNVDGFYENFKSLLDERRQFDAIYCDRRPDVEQQSTHEALTEQTAAPVTPMVADQPENKFTVMLTTVGSNKIMAIKAVREVTGLGLKESKDLVDAVVSGTPKPVRGSVSKDEGDFIAKQFAAAGATAEVK